MIAALRWILAALAPGAILLLAARRAPALRSEPRFVALTFVLGAALGGVTVWLQARATVWTGLDIRASAAGGAASALIYLLLVVAPVREGALVAAVAPGYVTRRITGPEEGALYAAVAALGFASVENGVVLHGHPAGAIWLARAILAMPAHVFFAAVWGYALGLRRSEPARAGNTFVLAWTGSMLVHGLYTHFVYGRGPGALVGVFPLLLAMANVVWFVVRDRKARLARATLEMPPISVDPRLSRLSFDRFSQPPSLKTVRAALRRTDQPIMVRWILVGALVTLGTMVAGLGASVAFGHWVHVDFSVVDEHDVTTVAPLVLLCTGILAGFPVSGFLVARASNLPTLLEPALATGLAILAVLVMLGLAAPVALVFGVAFSPIAFALACAGAWMGRPLG